MKTFHASRASAVLYNLLRSRDPADGVYLLPANVCPVVPLTCIAAGVPFELVDIAPDTLTIDPDLVLARMESAGPPVIGIVFVRTYGALDETSCLFQQLRSAAGSDLLIIDDRCLAIPEPDISADGFANADVILFSTGYSKVVDLGRGGFAHLGSHVAYCEHRRPYRSHDLELITHRYKKAIADGAPLYTGPIPSSLAQLEWLDTRRSTIPWPEYRRRILASRPQALAHKQRLNAMYRSLIPSFLRMGDRFDIWRHQLVVAQRDELIRSIFAAGYFASSHYFPSAVLFGGGEAPRSSALAGRVVNLFNDHRFDEDQARAVAELVARHVEAADTRSGADARHDPC